MVEVPAWKFATTDLTQKAFRRTAAQSRMVVFISLDRHLTFLDPQWDYLPHGPLQRLREDTLYAAFKESNTGAAGGLLGKMYHLFSMERELYLRRYHRRSMVKSTFSMVKRKFDDAVRAKSETTMKNETRAKFVCHNTCCVISAIYELGIDPTFIGLPGEEDGPRDVLRVPGA